MKSYALFYGMFLRFLVACFPMLWDEQSLSAARAALDRRVWRGGGRC